LLADNADVVPGIIGVCEPERTNGRAIPLR